MSKWVVLLLFSLPWRLPADGDDPSRQILPLKVSAVHQVGEVVLKDLPEPEKGIHCIATVRIALVVDIPPEWNLSGHTIGEANSDDKTWVVVTAYGFPPQGSLLWALDDSKGQAKPRTVILPMSSRITDKTWGKGSYQRHFKIDGIPCLMTVDLRKLEFTLLGQGRLQAHRIRVRDIGPISRSAPVSPRLYSLKPSFESPDRYSFDFSRTANLRTRRKETDVTVSFSAILPAKMAFWGHQVDSTNPLAVEFFAVKKIDTGPQQSQCDHRHRGQITLTVTPEHKAAGNVTIDLNGSRFSLGSLSRKETELTPVACAGRFAAH